jgi:hypothetical protein
MVGNGKPHNTYNNDNEKKRKKKIKAKTYF